MSSPTIHRAIAQVNLSALRANVAVVRARVGAGRRIMAVVKADAYGHGMVPVARACLAAGAEALGVATTAEALELRAAPEFARVPLLVMAPTLGSDAHALQNADVAVAIGNIRLLRDHLKLANTRGTPARLHIQIDTGIGRDGFRFDDLSWLDETRGVGRCVEGLFMHFAVADGVSEAENEFTRLQTARFVEVAATARNAGLRPLVHAANSGTVLRHPAAHFDMVRPGIMLYGCEPAGDRSLFDGLAPVMTLRSVIGSIREMEPGDTVSYGRLFEVPSRRRMAIVPIGYGDGYPRMLSNKFDVLIRGRRAPIRGRVCMDQIVVDLEGLPEAMIGDEVVLYGAQGAERITIEEAAAAAGTISYELTCRLTPRVPRVYTDGQKGAEA